MAVEGSVRVVVDESEAPVGSWWRAPLVVASLAAIAVGLAVVAWGLLLAGEAHLYRQRSHEGLMFLAAAVVLVAGGSVATAGAAGMLVFSRRCEGRVRLLAQAVAVGTAVVLTLGAGVAAWIEWHGYRCIGPCG